MPKEATNLPRDTSEVFAAQSRPVWVYTLWRKTDKQGRGMVGVHVFDAQNRSRVKSPPVRVSLSEIPLKPVKQ